MHEFPPSRWVSTLHWVALREQLSTVTKHGAMAAAGHGEPLCLRDFEAYLRRGVPGRTWEFLSAGASDGQTVRDNEAAYQR